MSPPRATCSNTNCRNVPRGAGEGRQRDTGGTVKKLFGEYRDFINQGNVVTVAVGLVMALYFKSIVDALINGVIMPIVSAIVGEQSFEDIDVGIGDATLEIGLVLQAVIMFIVVAFILFLIIKAYNSYIAKPKDEEGPTELDVLTEIRDELRAGR
jgi:large conductance mechanosensitive channel